MSDFSFNTIEFYVALVGIFFFLFVIAHDLVHKQLALFITSYFALVVLSEYIFGKEFSRKSIIGDYSVELVTPTLIIFWVSFFFAARVNVGLGSRNITPLRRPGGRGTTMKTVILALPLILFFLAFATNNGVRVTGSFLDYRGERSTLTDYMFVYLAVLVSHYRNSRLLLVVGLFAATAHFLSGERLRTFVYIILILINYFGLDNRRHLSSAILVVGFIVATLVGQLRSGNLGVEQEYNVTHFGSVTVSSLYLLDFGSTLSHTEKLKFLIGAFGANLLPSSLIPESFNVREAILTFADIPGGGWLPVFIKIMAGNFGVAIVGFAIGRMYLWIVAETRSVSAMQPAFYAAALVFVATSPRWFMYTPYQLLKMPLYAFLLSGAIVVMAKYWPKNRSSDRG